MEEVGWLFEMQEFLHGFFSELSAVDVMEGVGVVAGAVAVLTEVEVLALTAVEPDIEDGLDSAIVAPVIYEEVICGGEGYVLFVVSLSGRLEDGWFFAEADERGLFVVLDGS